jgi:hypothetical protein
MATRCSGVIARMAGSGEAPSSESRIFLTGQVDRSAGLGTPRF